MAEGYFWGQNPNINEELRRRIALQMLSGKKGFPKTVGEGLTAIGDAIGDRGLMNRLAAEEATSEAAGRAAVGRLGGPQAYAPTDDVAETPAAPAASAAPSEPPTPLFTAPEHPASMLRPELPTGLGGASAGGVGPESMYTSPTPLGMPAPAAARTAQATPAGYRPAPAYLASALERLVPDPERRGYLGHLASGEAKSANEVSPTGAAGPFQFTRGTGRQYGLLGAGGDQRTGIDPSILAANKLTDDNVAVLARGLGRQPTPSEMALAHQQGAGTAVKMLTGTGNAPAYNLAVNNVPAGLSPQASAQRVMSYYSMPGGNSPRDAVSAQLVAQGQDPVEPAPGQQATLGSPILPQGLSAAPPAAPIRSMPQPQPQPQQPVRVAQAGPPQGLTAGYVMPEQPKRTPPPTTTPTLQRIQQEIAQASPANKAAVQRYMQPYIDQEKARITDAHAIHKDQLIHDRAMELKRQDQLASSLKRQQDYDKAQQEFINGTGRPPSPANAATLGTPQSRQRTGIPSPMPTPPGVTPQKWAELQAPLMVKANEAYEKAVPSFNETIATLKLAREHPGREWGVGTFSDIAKRTPGTAAIGFGKIMEQIGGKNFLVAYQLLKGGGPITEIEGTKAEAAQARLSTAQNKEDFDAALNDFEKTLRSDLEQVQRKVNRPVTAWGKGNDDYAPDIGERGVRRSMGVVEYIGGNPALDSSYRKVR